MDGKKPSSKFWTLFNGACGVITALSWLGITPDRVGQVAYDVVYPVLPFAALVFGALTGWFAHDWFKWHEADTAARIERENAEHAEKMRRDREEYEKRILAEEEAREKEALDAARAKRDEDRKKAMVDAYRHASPSVKQHVMQMYEEGEVRMREDAFRMIGLSKWADYTTVDETYPGYDPIVNAYLTDETRSMLENDKTLIDEYTGGH